MRFNVTPITLALLLALLLPAAALAQHQGAGNFCSRSALDTLLSCRSGAFADYWVELGKCENLPTAAERWACKQEAREARSEALDECAEQWEARRDLCDELGEEPYHPEIDPDNFVAVIDNPYMPLTPNTRYIYEGMTEDGLEHIEIFVTGETKEILGVTCTVVRDTVTLEGELEEDTYDWFAQDLEGNVWYFGELSFNYEDGEISGIEGSWEAGVDGAKPGIVMKAFVPEVEDIYRQEFLLGEAEDIAEVLSVDENVEIDFGSWDDCLKTEETTPIEPDVLEYKFYAQGIGLVLEENPETGEQIELVGIEVK